MLEWLAFPLALAVAAAIPRGKENDKKKIETIFENTGFGITNKNGELKTPKYKAKESIMDGEKQIGTTYKFSIPLGLPVSKIIKYEKQINLFSDGLQKPVELSFRKVLNVQVYDEELPDFFPYEQLPKDSQRWVVPLGKSVNGLIWHNFDHTPHMTAAGTTRFGKTVLLRMVMTYLIENHPEDSEFFIIDLKGGLEFQKYQKLEQVKGMAADPLEAFRMLMEIKKKMVQDYKLFRKNYWSNVVDTPLKRRKFIIVDEAAQLAPDKFHSDEEKQMLGACQGILSEIARVAGALGYRLIFATQYPTADTLPRQIKQNSDAKISFRLPSGYASGVAIDDYGAEELPSNIKGRAIFKTHELKELQVPFLSHDEMWRRLEQYQLPERMEGEPDNVIEYRETETETRDNLVKFGEDEIRNQGTTPNFTQTRNRQKRTKSPK